MTLKLDNLVYRRNGRTILGPLSARIAPGELIGVVGPNGSGKSTLLRLLYGYLRPSQGEVYLDDSLVHSMDPQLLACAMGACPQQAETSLDFGVEQALALALPGGRLKRSSLNKLSFLRLEELLDRTLSRLSGGEQQKVRLARALMGDPPWLVLDEPTNHLDLATAWSLMSYLRGQRLGSAIIAIHDLHLAVRFCHRLLVLCQGKLVSFAPAKEALTPEILMQVFSLSGEVESIDGLLRLKIDGVVAQGLAFSSSDGF